MFPAGLQPSPPATPDRSVLTGPAANPARGEARPGRASPQRDPAAVGLAGDGDPLGRGDGGAGVRTADHDADRAVPVRFLAGLPSRVRPRAGKWALTELEQCKGRPGWSSVRMGRLPGVTVPRRVERIMDMNPEAVAHVLTKPISQELLDSDIPPAGVHGLDATPRVIPIAFHFDGSNFVVHSDQRREGQGPHCESARGPHGRRLPGQRSVADSSVAGPGTSKRPG